MKVGRGHWGIELGQESNTGVASCQAIIWPFYFNDQSHAFLMQQNEIMVGTTQTTLAVTM